VQPIQLDRTTTVDRVVAALKDELFRGRLLPGAQLREQALVDTLSVSRGTVREALQVLVAEGLFARVPNRGVVVRQLTRDDVDDIFMAREVLERAGVRAARTAPDEALSSLGQALDAYAATDDPAMANEAHLRFHTCLVALTGSRRLVSVAEALNADVRVAVASIDRTLDDLPQQIEEHRVLLDLLSRGRLPQAEDILAAHLVRARAYVMTELP
jgi:DNA-binding GntR family transcriptional regulator